MKVLNISDAEFKHYPIGAIKEVNFMGIDFFVHRSINDNDRLTVSDKKCGYALIYINHQDDTLEELHIFVDSKFKSKQDFKDKVSKRQKDYIEKNGIANK